MRGSDDGAVFSPRPLLPVDDACDLVSTTVPGITSLHSSRAITLRDYERVLSTTALNSPASIRSSRRLCESASTSSSASHLATWQPDNCAWEPCTLLRNPYPWESRSPLSVDTCTPEKPGTQASRNTSLHGPSPQTPPPWRTKEHTRPSVPIPGRNSHAMAPARTLPTNLNMTATRAALAMTTTTTEAAMRLSMAANIRIRDMREARR